jgi:steroid 5-alpha reductase family enzyme
MCMVWATRLCCFVFYRIWVRGHDWRFDKLAKAPGYSLFGWTSGGTWVFLQVR